MSLLSRVVLIIAVALLPPLGMQVYNESALRDARQQEVREQALSQARAVAGELDVIVASARAALIATAEVPAIRRTEREGCAALLHSLNARLAFLRQVELIEPDGHTSCDSLGTVPSSDRSDSEGVHLARARDGFAVGVFERGGGEPFLSMGYLIHETGQVLLADIDLDWLAGQIGRRGLPPGAALGVTDRNGTFLVRVPDRGLVGHPIMPEFRFLLEQAEPGVSEAMGPDGIHRIIGFVPLSPPRFDLFVGVGFSTVRAYAASDAAALRGYALIALGLGAALTVAGVMVQGTISNPMRAILAATERWQAGDAAARVPAIRGRTEFGRIGQAVNALLDAVEAGQQGLRAGLAELKAVYDAAPVGLGYIDRDLRYVTVNAQLAALDGVPASEHRGRSLRDIVPDAEAGAESLLRRALAGEAIAPGEVRVVVAAQPGSAEGADTYRQLLIGYQPAVAQDGHVIGVVIAVQDITALHQAETALQETLQRANTELERRVVERTRQFEAEVHEREEAQAQLLQSQKMQVVGQLTGGVAHDFNNLLTAIIGNLELALVRAAERPDVTRLLQGALRAADRGAKLTQRMLAFGRRQYLQFETVDVAALLAGISDLLVRSLGPIMEVVIKVPDAVRPARADPNQIELAVLNLAVNARDAMPDGGTVTIWLSEEHVDGVSSHPAGLASGNYVRLAVSDAGTGMDAETCARAFEPFFTTKAVGKGSGLGLSMVQGLAAQSGGGAAIESTVGKGTTVTVWLPCAPEISPTFAAPLREVARTHADVHVLVVDDDPDVLVFASVSLEEAGYVVTRATDGEAALALLTGGPPPDLIVTDLALPGISGRILATKARALFPDLPILLATGYADQATSDTDEMRLPVLAKPFRGSELLAEVAALLGPPNVAA